MRPTTNTCSIISLAALPHERETAAGGSPIKSITIGLRIPLDQQRGETALLKHENVFDRVKKADLFGDLASTGLSNYE
jgi:hypothetical protein